MTQRLFVWAALPLLIVVVLGQAGCRPKAVAASPDKARELLRQGLDAWKGGQTPEALRAGASITFSDSDWKAGAKLLDYEVQGDGKSDGFDWQCRVKLVLQNGKGAKTEQRAVYNISTAPKLVVVRMEF